MAETEDAQLRLEVAKYEELLQKSTGRVDLDRERGTVLLNLGESLLSLHEYKQAVPRFAQAATLLWTFEDEHMWAVNAHGRQAAALLMLGRDSEAVEVLNQLVGRVGLDWIAPAARNPDAEDVIADQLPIALGPWLFLLRRLGRDDELISAADALIGAYDPPSSWRRLLVVADAFEKKGDVAAARGDDATALACFESAIERCRNQVRHEARTNQALLAVLLRALAGRAGALERTGRGTEALADYDELIKLCARSSDPDAPEIRIAAREARSRLRGKPMRLRRALLVRKR